MYMAKTTCTCTCKLKTYKYIISNNKIRICSCTKKCYKKIKHIYYNTVEPVLRGHRLTEKVAL
jgi:hypothetical protein